MAASGKESDVRITPEWFLEYVRAFCGGPIPLDVCTEPNNPTKALAFYCEQGDLLPWDYSPVWCNPPYSAGQVLKWATVATEHARNAFEILFLTKDDCRTGWNRYLLENADARCRVRRGVGFLEPDGKGGYTQLVGPRWGTCLWYFGLQRRRFTRVFSPLGEVTQLMGPQELLNEAAE